MEVLLYAPQYPGNLGSIVRTSAAWNINKIYIFDRHHLLGHKTTRKLRERVSMGHDHEVELIPVKDAERFVQNYEHPFATALENAKRLGDSQYDLKIPEDALIMFGNENTGLPDVLLRLERVQKVTIPTRSPDHCFNLSVAYGIVMYEVLRQNPHHFPR